MKTISLVARQSSPAGVHVQADTVKLCKLRVAQRAPNHDLRKWKMVLSFLSWFRLRNLWESTVLKSELAFSVTVLYYLWNNKVLFNRKSHSPRRQNRAKSSSDVNQHDSFAISMAPMCSVEQYQFNSAEGFGLLFHSSKKLSCLPSLLTEAVCSLNLMQKICSDTFYLYVLYDFAHSSYEFNGICLIFIKPWKIKKCSQVYAN